MGCIMKTPPIFSTVRVNTLKLTMEEAKDRLEAILRETYTTRRHSIPRVSFHPVVPDVLIIAGSGPHIVAKKDTAVYVDVSCGKSVMRGADIFATGILGSNRDFKAGQEVSILMDIDQHCRRGTKSDYAGNCVFLGNGITHQSRSNIFKIPPSEKPRGLGVSMVEQVWNNPKLYGIVEDWGFPQNLPSVVCGHALNVQPGQVVLDMCAAPGGKSTHIASLMNDQGRLVCVDDRKVRLQEVARNASALSLSCIETYQMDAIKLVREPGKRRANESLLGPPFPPETFDRVLLDAPCSGLGQRPLLFQQNPNQVRSFPALQRKLLKTAYRLLRRGGTLVYSTCTLREEENEQMVSWTLDNFADLQVFPQRPFISPLVPKANDRDGFQFLQKFDPRRHCKQHQAGANDCLTDYDQEAFVATSHSDSLTVDEDTIGFFIARFVKR